MAGKLKRDANAVEILKFYRDLAWPVIRAELKDPAYPYHFRVPTKYRAEHKFHWDVISDYPKRQGKYLRPTLVVLTAEAMGATKRQALKVAAAMQLSEEWMLIHDDFEDGSVKRRGLPALHRIHGDEMAVNAGDALHIVMWKVFVENMQGMKPSQAKRIAADFHAMFMRTVLGQMVEIKWMVEGKSDFSDDDWMFIADGKSAYYTIVEPMRLGAIVAGANTKQLDALAKFGLYLGRCFQLVDDILDLTGDFGGRKEWANDIYEGKRTVILGHLMRSAGKRDRKKLTEILAKSRKEKTETDVRWVLERMTHYRSIIYAQEMAKEFRDKAEEVFEKELGFLKKEPARGNIEKLMQFVLERDH